MKHYYLLLFLLGTFCLQAQQLPVGHDAPDLEVRIHPNPAPGPHVEIVTRNHSPKEIAIYDIFGKAVLHRRIQGTTLDIRDLSPGVYMVRIVQQGKSTIKKLIVR